MNTMSKSNGGNGRQGRFDWLFSEFTIGLVLLAMVMPAVVQGLSSLNQLPVA